MQHKVPDKTVFIMQLRDHGEYVFYVERTKDGHTSIDRNEVVSLGHTVSSKDCPALSEEEALRKAISLAGDIFRFPRRGTCTMQHRRDTAISFPGLPDYAGED
ncbi:MAG: hypothetical protein OXT67_01390 [Zetaproteobacteria bacterium]|nr:hypothetical protein [Zetaproteobacteria bacterium]